MWVEQARYCSFYEDSYQELLPCFYRPFGLACFYGTVRYCTVSPPAAVHYRQTLNTVNRALKWSLPLSPWGVHGPFHYRHGPEGSLPLSPRPGRVPPIIATAPAIIATEVGC